MRLGAVESQLILHVLRSLEVTQLLSGLVLHGYNKRMVLLDQILDLSLQHLYLLLIDQIGVLKRVDLGIEL